MFFPLRFSSSSVLQKRKKRGGSPWEEPRKSPARSPPQTSTSARHGRREKSAQYARTTERAGTAPRGGSLSLGRGASPNVVARAASVLLPAATRASLSDDARLSAVRPGYRAASTRSCRRPTRTPSPAPKRPNRSARGGGAEPSARSTRGVAGKKGQRAARERHRGRFSSE